MLDRYLVLEYNLLGEDYLLVDTRAMELKKIFNEVINCRKCELYKTRVKAVSGCGSIKSRIMFIGEAPGYEEDKKGEPFVGRAGKLLDELLEKIGLNRSMVYITNVVKCHPVVVPDPYKKGNDRPPNDFEISMCMDYLIRQIELIKPRVIVLLGATSLYALTGIKSISKTRGVFINKKISGVEVKILPTYHPAAVLRNPALLKDIEEDFLKLKVFV